MELRLDREIADSRIFPAIDIKRSGTRREELLLDADSLSKAWLMRRALSNQSTIDAISLLLNKLKKTKSNIDFLNTIKDENNNR
jgi:transcription termination factor Rho